MKKGSILTTLILAVTLLAGCTVPKGKEKEVVEKSKKWLDTNDYVVTKDTDFSKDIFENVGKVSEGTVFSEYKYFDTKNEGYFEDSVRNAAQSEMLRLLLNTYTIYKNEDYLKKAVLIGDNLLEQVFETEIRGKDVHLVKSGYYYNKNVGSWDKSTSVAYTEEQLNTAYALLRLYDVTKTLRYLKVAEDLLNSQMAISSLISEDYSEGMLPYKYSVVSSTSKKYDYEEVFPLFLSKSCYETFSLAYELTDKSDFKDFANKNGDWLLNIVDKATLKSGMIFGAVEYSPALNETFINRTETDSWSYDSDIITEDMLETLIALSYIDKEKASNYKSKVVGMDIQEVALRDTVFNKLTHNGKKPVSKLEGYYQDAYSSVLRLEYLKNVEWEETKLSEGFRRVLGLIENMGYDDKNSTGAVCRNFEYAKIDTFTTAYLLSFVTKYYTDK